MLSIGKFIGKFTNLFAKKSPDAFSRLISKKAATSPKIKINFADVNKEAAKMKSLDFEDMIKKSVSNSTCGKIDVDGSGWFDELI